MIIPVRCTTCGKPIGQFWEEFKERTGKGEDPKKVMDGLGMERYCCRSHMLSHVDMIEKTGKFQK
jgi:DNA-directed RNA polymerase subunit N